MGCRRRRRRRLGRSGRPGRARQDKSFRENKIHHNQGPGWRLPLVCDTFSSSLLLVNFHLKSTITFWRQAEEEEAEEASRC